MSTPSTTIWRLDRALEQEGSALLFDDDRLLFASDAHRSLESDGYLVGFFTYEQEPHFYKPARVEHLTRPPPLPLPPPNYTLLDRSDCRDTIYGKIAEIKGLIEAGDVYQVNLTQSFTFATEHAPFELFKRLYNIFPARFAAYINCGEFQVLSFSPELFLKRRGDRLTTSPIKGTMPRGETVQEDQALKEALLTSEKERAELLMITDLMRNDLAMVCSSVETTECFTCTSYPTIYHLHSTVEGIAQPLPPLELIARLLPAGSISGCPKGRAIETISHLEKRQRGVYTGVLGSIEPSGDFTFNVAIRTLVYKDGVVTAQFGGGIVYDSDPEKEYEEALHKARSLFHELPEWSIC